MVKIKLSTSDRLKQIMKERDLKQVDILTLCEPYCKSFGVKLPKNTLSEYISGKVIPKQDKLTVLAQALRVNEVWLMGYHVSSAPDAFDHIETNVSKPSKLQEEISSIYGKNVLQLVNSYQRFDELDKVRISERIEILLEDKKYSCKNEFYQL